MPSWNGGWFSMNKIGPCFPTRPFEASPAFSAWLDLFAAGVPHTERQPVADLMNLHATWAAKIAKEAARRAAK